MTLPRSLAVIAAATVLMTGCGHPAPKPAPSTSSPTVQAQPPVRSACGDPTLLPPREKLAQLLMVGVRDGDDATAVVTKYHVGGIFFGSWTDPRILGPNLSRDLSVSTALPVAVSVDEEGGRVSRLSKQLGPAPSARELAKHYTPEQVYGMALDRGHRMRGLGITIDFAPDTDVVEDDVADDTVIGDRSFGADPAKVVEYARQYARGLRDAEILPVFKHFPGHGHGSGDSHTGSVIVTPPLAQLQDKDLVPYRVLLAEPGKQGAMVGHLQVPGLTGDEPASVSQKAVQMLRTGSGYNGPHFDGPIFSDDLSSMAAIKDHYTVPEAVLRTLQSGTDVALWITTDEVPAVLDRLQKALDAKELKMSDVDDSVRRIEKFKGHKADCGP
ncbi:glycoside hydrolase family 3 N-terminal domain-containing protein [Candidatus Mycobacterium wuenschmannii]|uniref:beta-N-acetylhexosaminidase n=1 Tax=Candidatus Mycobacterium wuenschmannii TaxID=3027808 RepID=A0ABY8VVT2_9MYCO|nr:glycoside hydrolase family 3 N-terminal domain-containing protein [Candidatus Mycobacterium wuenschmannii]WIM87051.1 glycoside hydrolase family 3 N-terminal domain-containing protein [Candidatus Mycobacterium wuenschmannii]